MLKRKRTWCYTFKEIILWELILMNFVKISSCKIFWKIGHLQNSQKLILALSCLKNNLQ